MRTTTFETKAALLSLCLCLLTAAAQAASNPPAATAPAQVLDAVRKAPAGSTVADYTLEQVLQGVASRDAKYRATPWRIDYSHTVNNAQGQPPQKTECTLLIHGSNFRNEVHDAKGRKGWEYRVNGIRAEAGRRWAHFDMLLPYNDVDSEERGDRIYFHTHNVGFNSESMLALLVDGIEPWRVTYFRQAEKAGNLRISRGEINGISCVQLSAGGVVLCLAPQYDWAILRSSDVTARDFRQFGDRYLPTKVERVRNSHDFQGGFFTYRESCEIHKVSPATAREPDFWKIPEPKPGTWVKVAYPRWNNQWEDDLGPALTKQAVLDSVRAEHAFAWPPAGKDARIYETSRHWRDAAKLDLALRGTAATSDDPRPRLPFMSADGEQIIWATYDPDQQRLTVQQQTSDPSPAESKSR